MRPPSGAKTKNKMQFLFAVRKGGVEIIARWGCNGVGGACVWAVCVASSTSPMGGINWATTQRTYNAASSRRAFAWWALIVMSGRFQSLGG